MDKKRAIIFDLDGTLIDTMDIYARKAAALMARYYGIPLEKGIKLYYQTSGLPFIYQLNKLFPDDREKNKLVSEKFEQWKESLSDRVSLPKESRDVLLTLRKRGFFLAVSSNNLHDIVCRWTQNWPIDISLGFDEEKMLCKGAPHLEIIKKKAKCSEKDVLFVGDSLNDAKLAKEMRVSFIAIQGMFSKEEFLDWNPEAIVVSSIRDVVRVVGVTEKVK